MRRAIAGPTLVIAAALFAAACQGDAGADGDSAQPTGADSTGWIVERDEEEIRGSFSMVAMAHTTSYGGAGIEQEARPWDGTAETGGPYRYAAIACSENAPVNNISSDLPSFNTMIPGSRIPASTRSHPLQFDVVEGEGGELQLKGSIELTVCQLRPGVTPDPDPVPDAEKDRIQFEWTADFDEATAESVVWRGQFQIAGGTGPYEDLAGDGTIAGAFLCFAPEGCEELGEFRDVQYSLIGTYRVPTDALDESAATAAAAPDSSG